MPPDRYLPASGCWFIKVDPTTLRPRLIRALPTSSRSCLNRGSWSWRTSAGRVFCGVAFTTAVVPELRTRRAKRTWDWPYLAFRPRASAGSRVLLPVVVARHACAHADGLKTSANAEVLSVTPADCALRVTYVHPYFEASPSSPSTWPAR